MYQPSISKSAYVGGIAASVAATLLFFVLGVAKGGSEGQEIVMVAWLPIIVTAIFMGSLIYRMWAAIQDGYARTTPGKAVALLFVPFLNFGWAFRALPGFAEDYNSYLVRHGISARPLSAGLFRTYVILCLGSLVPVVGVVCSLIAIPVALAMIAAICDAINALGTHPIARRWGFDGDADVAAADYEAG